MVLTQRRARRAALPGCRCRDPLFGGLASRRPRASEMSKNILKDRNFALSRLAYELPGWLEAR